MDYYEIQQLAKKYNVASSKLPFQKFVVLTLGTTSAGKSSFINHFFGYPFHSFILLPSHILSERGYIELEEGTWGVRGWLSVGWGQSPIAQNRYLVLEWKKRQMLNKISVSRLWKWFPRLSLRSTLDHIRRPTPIGTASHVSRAHFLIPTLASQVDMVFWS